MMLLHNPAFLAVLQVLAKRKVKKMPSPADLDLLDTFSSQRSLLLVICFVPICLIHLFLYQAEADQVGDKSFTMGKIACLVTPHYFLDA
jgi:hypothetical protein